MRLLVTGGAGMLGKAVAAAAREQGHAIAAPSRAELDVTDPAAVRDALRDARADAVINCAAWTDVDGAEADEAGALAINGSGAENVARAAGQAGARVVHVSTDYVFPGDATRPYVESDAAGPLSAYGRTKLEGEVRVVAAARDHAIARTAWLFGAGGSNFVDSMLRMGAERGELRVVDDQIGCPTWTGHLAPALVALAGTRATGVFHAAGGGRCSWFDLASAAIDGAGIPATVAPATTAEFPRPAPRPAFAALASERGADAVALPPWEHGLQAYLTERAAARAGEQSTTAAGGTS